VAIRRRFNALYCVLADCMAIINHKI